MTFGLGDSRAASGRGSDSSPVWQLGTASTRDGTPGLPSRLGTIVGPNVDRQGRVSSDQVVDFGRGVSARCLRGARCLDRRIATREELIDQIAACEDDRNERQVRIRWRFTVDDARIMLRRLYLAAE